jgi:DNA replication and repair protein RecF
MVHLAWLFLEHFRVHERLAFQPDAMVNVLVGDNGSGKTSVLEAIGYLVTLTSFRRAPDAALVSTDASAAVIRGGFTVGGREITVETQIPAAGRRRVLLNGKPVRSRGDIAESVTLVSFLPDDLGLIKDGPARRREFLDDVTVQLWPGAATEQREFDRALRQRNALLRREGRHADPATLDVLDERLTRLGTQVVMRRLAATRLLVGPATEIFAALGDGWSPLSWSYMGNGLGVVDTNSSATSVFEGLDRATRAAREHDLDRKVTTVGPHRDDLAISIGNRDARTRASQGEQRSIALVLRVASHRVLSEQRGQAPILLLDDVFSELDPDRGDRMVSQLPGDQVFVTSAREGDVPFVGVSWTVMPGAVMAR